MSFHFARLLGAAATALLVTLGGCSDPGRPRPNLILISVDTLRPDRLGCYGAERPTSPALDALARRGVLATDVTAPSPWTLPSHVSLLTGLYPSRHGVKDQVHELRPDASTLAELLSAAGYRTHAIVNAHYVSDRYGLGRGFEVYDYVSEWAVEPDGRRSVVNRGPEITGRAMDWLRSVGDERFFLFLHYYDVHTDLDPAPQHREAFAREYPGAPTGRTDELLRARRGERQLTDRDVQHLLDLYDAEIRTLDDHLERLFRYLDEHGRTEDTLVVVTSDHGEEWLEHGSLLHGKTYYQEVIAVPLILAGPGITPGARIEDPVSLVDVVPSLLPLLGQPVPPGLDGRDLELIRDGARRERRFLFAEADHNNVVDGKKVQDLRRLVRHGDWKLHYDTQTGATELFDLGADPGETRDLSGSEPERALLLEDRLRAFLEAETRGAELAPLSDEERERLEALGYGD